MFLGTHADNMADMRQKNRAGQRGSRSHKTGLVDADVIEIRRLAANGVPQCRIAVLYGMSEPAVSEVVNRRKWRHVV